MGVIFSLRNPPDSFSFTLNNIQISLSNYTKFFGIIFDKTLTFKRHILFALTKCNTYLKILQYLTGTTFGCSFKGIQRRGWVAIKTFVSALY